MGRELLAAASGGWARDIGGTGLFDAEYLVASKAWGPFDFTLGLGWGYLGTTVSEKSALFSQ
ncbi:putative lipoprotein [Escherichia coli]|uniref:Putative lipoprotein n=1 Tax=Escherichia coli TaxID=562 RepID=A0A377B818_ECOLX|nr:putative lipoprotein [Escherichia coli]